MNLITTKNKTLTNSLTGEELATILVDKLIRYGECISLSAPNNFGKTNFLHRLEMSSRRRSHSNLLVVFIDCNLRADDSQQAFYELIMKELVTVFNNSDLIKLYEGLVDSSNKDSFQINHIFLTVFEIIRELLVNSPDGKNRLVLVLDEFDQVCSKLPAAVFRHLRSIKDRHGKGLVFFVGTNRPLVVSGREEEEDIAEFYELFDLTNQVHLLPLSYVESNELINSHLPEVPADIAGLIYDLAGGHPSLTLRLIQLIKTTNECSCPGLEEIKALARLDPQLKLECRRIWNSLDPTEKIVLLQRLEGIKTLTVDPLLGTLEERGLLKPSSDNSTNSNSSSDVFATIFKWFLEEKLQAEKERTISPDFGYSYGTTSIITEPTAAKQNGLTFTGTVLPITAISKGKLAFDPVHEIIVFESEMVGGSGKNGNQIPLTGNSALLFKYLFLRQSIPYCSKDELISAVWGQEAAYSSENLDRLVSDLRQLIGDHDKQIIRTIHRRGLQMVGVEEWRPVTNGLLTPKE